MTNRNTTKQLDPSKLLGFRSTGPKVGDKAPATTAQAKVGNKIGTKIQSKVGNKPN